MHFRVRKDCIFPAKKMPISEFGAREDAVQTCLQHDKTFSCRLQVGLLSKLCASMGN